MSQFLWAYSNRHKTMYPALENRKVRVYRRP